MVDVGDDAEGAIITDTLARAGCRMDFVRTLAAVPTPRLAHVIETVDGTRRHRFTWTDPQTGRRSPPPAEGGRRPPP